MDETKEFYKLLDLEGKGVWLGMFRSNNNVKSIAYGMCLGLHRQSGSYNDLRSNLYYMSRVHSTWNANDIKSIDFYGGAIQSYIRDLMFLLLKNVDIYSSGFHHHEKSLYNLSTAVLDALFFKGGRFKCNNSISEYGHSAKIFHTTYLVNSVDPLIDGQLFMGITEPDPSSTSKYRIIIFCGRLSKLINKNISLSYNGDGLSEMHFVTHDESGIYPVPYDTVETMLGKRVISSINLTSSGTMGPSPYGSTGYATNYMSSYRYSQGMIQKVGSVLIDPSIYTGGSVGSLTTGLCAYVLTTISTSTSIFNTIPAPPSDGLNSYGFFPFIRRRSLRNSSSQIDIGFDGLAQPKTAYEGGSFLSVPDNSYMRPMFGLVMYSDNNFEP